MHFIVIFALLIWSGTGPTVFPRCAYTYVLCVFLSIACSWIMFLLQVLLFLPETFNLNSVWLIDALLTYSVLFVIFILP